MIVEFLGTPGAGKTTLVPVVAEELRGRGICGRTILDAARPVMLRSPVGAALTRLAPPKVRRVLLWQLFYHASTLQRPVFFARHARLIRHVLSAQARRPIPIEERLHALRWFFVLTGQYELLRTRTLADEALILDEGFVHRSVQMHASDVETPDPSAISDYLARIPCPQLLIVVRAPWQTCVERIYRRGLWTRFEHKTRAQVERYVINAHRVVEIATDVLTRERWPLIVVDNDGDPMAARANLAGALRSVSLTSSQPGRVVRGEAL